jgi:hypothetical protein
LEGEGEPRQGGGVDAERLKKCLASF